MFHDAVGFVTGHCDIRTLGALESLSQSFRACAIENALWRDLLKDRSPSLGKQPSIFARQILKQMVQFVPMNMRPFPTSVAQLSSAELREYYWCVDVQYLREPLFSGLISFQSSGQLFSNEVCAQKVPFGAIENILVQSLQGVEIKDFQCNLWLFKSGSRDIVASLFSTCFQWSMFEFNPMHRGMRDERIDIIVNLWLSHKIKGKRILRCSLYPEYGLNRHLSRKLTEGQFVDLLSACLLHRSDPLNAV